MKKGIKLLVFVLGIIFILKFNIASALEFDNVKNYNPITREVKIINSFGLGSEIGGARLKTPLNYKVGQGYQKVAEFDLWAYQDYNDILKSIEFYDKNQKDWQEYKFEREFDIKYKTYEAVLIDDFEQECSIDEKSENKTQICNYIKVGSHYENKEVWKKIALADLKKDEVVTIGIFTDVKSGDYVEWIPQIYGVKVDEWATWTEDLTANLVAYWKLDEVGGETAIDELNNYEGKGLGGYSPGATGLIGSAWSLDGTNGTILLPNETFGEQETRTINMWVYARESEPYYLYVSYFQDDSFTLEVDSYDRLSFNVRDKDAGVWNKIIQPSASTTIDLNFWQMITLIIEKPNKKAMIYLNGLKVGEGIWGSYNVGQNVDRGTSIGGWGLIWGLNGVEEAYMDGLIDEVGMWKRVLTANEIAQLYNDSNGMAYISAETPNITLNSPENHYNSTSSEITFNCTVLDGSENALSNVTFYLNGIANETNSSGFENTNYIFTKTLIDGNYNWTCGACDDENKCANASERSFEIDTIHPNITILYPVNGETYTTNYANSSTIDIDLNWTTTDTNLDTCWYYNGTANTTITCGDNTTITLPWGEHTFKVYANDTFGLLTEEEVSATWNSKILGRSYNYNSDVIHSTQQTFIANLTLNNLPLSDVYLNYNGTNYLINSITYDGLNYILSKTITIPSVSVDTNISFYFIIDGYSTESFNQTIYISVLDNCSSYTYNVLNISLFDEQSLEQINGSIELLFELMNNQSFETLSYINLSTTANATNICSNINLSGKGVLYSVEIIYGADGYTKEFYHIQRAGFENPINDLKLYTLNESKFTLFKTTYRNENYVFVEMAVIQLLKKYISENVYRIVEAPITSNEGTANLHIDLDSSKYKVIVTKNGILLDTFDNVAFNCDSILTGECNQKLLGKINPPSEIDYDIERDFSYLVTSTNETITATYTIPSSSPSIINMQLTQLDQFGNTVFSNETLTFSAGSIDFPYETYSGDSYLELKIFKNGKLMATKTFIVQGSGGIDFLDNNHIFMVVLILTLVGMALTSPEWIVVNGVITLFLSGMLFLVNGLNFVQGFGLLMWLLIAIGILIMKLSKQEDK